MVEMRSIGLLDDLSPAEQEARRQDVIDGLLMAVSPVTEAVQTASDIGAMAFDPDLFYEFQQDPQSVGDRFAALNLNVGVPTMALGSLGRPDPNVLMANGRFGGILDEIPEFKVQRMLDVAEGNYKNQPLYKSGTADLGRNKPAKEFDEMTSVQDRVVPLNPSEQVDLSRFVGEDLIVKPADRTSIGMNIKEVDGVPLVDGGSTTEGGILFANVNPRIWASGVSQISSLANRINKTIDEKGGAIPIPMIMASQADEYSRHGADVILKMLPSMDIPKKTIKKLDDALKKVEPDFAGVMTDKGKAQIATNPSLNIELLRKTESIKGGLPDVQSVRKAITQEGMLGQPEGLLGAALNRITSPVKMVDSTHHSYPKTLDIDLKICEALKIPKQPPTSREGQEPSPLQ